MATWGRIFREATALALGLNASTKNVTIIKITASQETATRCKYIPRADLRSRNVLTARGISAGALPAGLHQNREQAAIPIKLVHRFRETHHMWRIHIFRRGF